MNKKLICIHLILFLSSEVYSLSEKDPENNNTHYLIPGSEALQVSGYFQIQGYAENSGDGNLTSQYHEDGLRIRRARLGAEGRLLPVLDYRIQANGNSLGVNLEDVFIVYSPWKVLNIKFGRFAKPFGNELYTPSQFVNFSERSRYWSFLFNEKKGNGLEASVNFLPGGNLKLQTAFFYDYTNGFTAVRRQDLVTRLILDTMGFEAGASFNAGFQRYQGNNGDNEFKGGLFAGYHELPLKLDAEVVFFFNGTSGELNGAGGHVSVSHVFFQHLKMSHRISYTYLLKNITWQIKEIGYGDIAINEAPLSNVFEYTLDLAYYFYPQSGKFTNQTRVSLEYSPSLELKQQTLSHAFYLQFQLCF